MEMNENEKKLMLLGKMKEHNENLKKDIPHLVIKLMKSEYPDKVDTNSGFRILDTYDNLKYLLSRFQIQVRWNKMTRVREIEIPKYVVFLDDEENSALRIVTNLAILNFMPILKIDSHLDYIAQQNAYHPIVDCILSKEWDGEERLQQFIETVKTSNDYLSHKLIRRWMISAIAAAFSERGCAIQGALVLQGKQNIGKTRWVKSLEPTPCNAIKDGALLDPASKDSIIGLARYWIVELGELDATFKKSDIARLKSHITSDTDDVRFPYARKNTRLPRKTVYVATVNESSYLIDETGNRRWWTIPVIGIDLKHDLDMQQVWAEAHILWKSGEHLWLSDEEMRLLNTLNEDHESIDPFEEKLRANFDWSEDWEEGITQEMTAGEVLHLFGYDKPSKGDSMRMAKILRKLTGHNPRKDRKGRFYKMPRKIF